MKWVYCISCPVYYLSHRLTYLFSLGTLLGAQAAIAESALEEISPDMLELLDDPALVEAAMAHAGQHGQGDDLDAMGSSAWQDTDL